MPRTARASVGGVCYHVFNRGNADFRVFRNQRDYQLLIELMQEAQEGLPMRVLAYCLMANHFHMVLWPRRDGDLSRWMQRLLTGHVRRHHQLHRTSGHVWQGRFRAFPIQQDEHLLRVLRFVEANPVRAKLVPQAQDWRWSSLHWWLEDEQPAFLHAGPVPRGRNWVGQVNKPMPESELAVLRHCVMRGTPFGTPAWQKRTAEKLNLQSTMRPRGRPRKTVNA